MLAELLNDMALFVDVVRARSFRGAAKAVGLPVSSVSRRIAGLEKAIGLRLLHRTTRSMELTEAGRLYLERAERIVAEARLAHEQLGDMLEQPSGLIRASLPVDFATVYLTPVIAEFARRYPAIAFELDLTPRNVNLVSEPFDLAIRIGQPPDSGLIGHKLGVLRAHLYASPEYLAEHGVPTAPADLAGHSCLPMTDRPVWRLTGPDGLREVEVDGRYRANSGGMLRQLATLHQGIAMLPQAIVLHDREAGRLVRILPDWQGTPVPVFALTETRLLPAKTQRFVEFLREQLGAVCG
jgi:DNA-binding transcriptional LysR family regulator